MDCIACGLCIDACDDVMEKVGLPKGLIRYDTESKEPFTLLRPRNFWYAGIISLVGCLMLYSLLTRSPLDVNILHDRNPLFVVLSDGEIRNGYNITIINKHHVDKSYRISIKGLENSQIRVQASSDIPSDNMMVFANSAGHFRVFVTSARQTDSRKNIEFIIAENDSEITETAETIFVSAGK
jgi:polyferredoxin